MQTEKAGRSQPTAWHRDDAVKAVSSQRLCWIYVRVIDTDGKQVQPGKEWVIGIKLPLPPARCRLYGMLMRDSLIIHDVFKGYYFTSDGDILMRMDMSIHGQGG